MAKKVRKLLSKIVNQEQIRPTNDEIIPRFDVIVKEHPPARFSDENTDGIDIEIVSGAITETLCGARIRCHYQGRISVARLGGVIEIKTNHHSQFYGLTLAHIVTGGDNDGRTSRSEPDQVDSTDSSDSDEESNGLISIPDRDIDSEHGVKSVLKSRSPQNVDALSPISNGSRFTQLEVHEASKNPPDSRPDDWKPFGRLVYYDGFVHQQLQRLENLDWALVELNDFVDDEEIYLIPLESILSQIQQVLQADSVGVPDYHDVIKAMVPLFDRQAHIQHSCHALIRKSYYAVQNPVLQKSREDVYKAGWGSTLIHADDAPLAKGLRDTEIIPKAYEEDAVFTTAIARFTSMTDAFEAQATLDANLTRLAKCNTMDLMSSRKILRLVSPQTAAQKSLRFSSTFQSTDKSSSPLLGSPPDHVSSEASSHLGTIFSAQSPETRAAMDRFPVRGWKVINEDSGSVDTGELLKDPLVYMNSSSTPSERQEYANPQLPMEAFSALSLKTNMNNGPYNNYGSLPSKVPARTLYAQCLQYGRSGPYSRSLQPYISHN
ncbi:uncharacterized protein Z519_09942 [Cladophialophora bantiana CBS 173.52]|uniref:Uncharacterized protein n=1 Tax=Cladophialophora bantiana (strain ATCC 10958 / CBS 173.52 / CDC B-1940 / NIH 8579) TaxID=1442370 RepID=A0A0D2HG54_CLAB1|nr:uncharacterized protein Z519_09942 [Cladophialophora bantiana CBS 173.52]KIW89785.1 hypothetical protein Z519_09942 [Cladophialophora bantiana CBS 173.52]